MDAFTLDQLRVFVTVVEQGSFSTAARKLRRAQSAITYATQKLEEHAGAALFDREGYRPGQSEAGRLLLPQARRVLDDVARFGLIARGMGQGLEVQLRLGIAAGLPIDLLTPALADFHAGFPTVPVRLIVYPFSLSGDRDAPSLAAGTADLRILVDHRLPDTFVRYQIGAIELVPVVASCHPLAGVVGVVDAAMLRDHLQIVLSEVAESVAGEDMQVAAQNCWRVTDQTARHAIIRAGIGWGSLPAALVEDDLATGRLVRLSVRNDGRFRLIRNLDIVVGHRHDEPPGVAGQWLLNRLSRGGSPYRLGSDPI